MLSKNQLFELFKNALIGGDSIIPNPNNGIFRIVTTDLKGSTLTIFNAIGEIIYQSTIVNPQSDLDLSNQPSGIYFLHINGENKSSTKKIVLTAK